MERIVVAFFGTTIGIEAPAALLAQVGDQLQDLVAPPQRRDPTRTRTLAITDADADAEGSGLRLLDQGQCILEGIRPDTAVSALLWHLNAIAVADPAHLAVHAACVDDGLGALVMPGPSGAGKSWLAAALVEGGCSYLSDEHAALDLDTGLVDPMAKPLDLGRRGIRPVGSLTARRTHLLAPPAAPRALVFPQFRAHAVTAVAPLGPAEALLLLATQCTNLVGHGAPGFLALADLATRPAVRCRYGDAAAATADLHAWLATLPPGVAIRRHPALHPVTSSTTTVAMGSDLVVFDQRDGTTHLLNASAGLVWLCAADAADEDEIVAAAVAESPGRTLDPADAARTIDRLRELGLLDAFPSRSTSR